MNSDQDLSGDEREQDRFTFRFGFRHLLYAIALIASGLALMGPVSLVFSLPVLGFWTKIYLTRPAHREYAGLLIGLIVLIAIALLLLPSIQVVRESSRRITCMNNMRQLVLAIHNYESAYRRFPPAANPDRPDRPRLSWRVRIWPFSSETPFPGYSSNEPWDGPNNRILASQRPSFYACSSSNLLPYQTTYKLITGPGTAFSGDKPLTFEDIKDGSSSALIMIEDFSNPINWLEPKDLTVEEAIKAITQSPHIHQRETYFTISTYGPNVCFLDGTVHSINPLADQEQLRQAMLIADGNAPELTALKGPHVAHKPQAYLTLGIYLVLLVLPGVRLWWHREPREPTVSED